MTCLGFLATFHLEEDNPYRSVEIKLIYTIWVLEWQVKAHQSLIMYTKLPHQQINCATGLPYCAFTWDLTLDLPLNNFSLTDTQAVCLSLI